MQNKIFDEPLDAVGSVNPKLRKLLESQGIKSLRDIIIRKPVQISESVGIDLPQAINIWNTANSRLQNLEFVPVKFVTGLDFDSTRRNKIQRISTGSKSLDEMFGSIGGIETGAITQIYGEAGSGKTQLCHCLSVMVSQDKSNGGLNSPALYIDTENTFRPERIKQIARARGYQPDETLDNIVISPVHNVKEQESALGQAHSIIDSEGIKLIVVDSIIKHYRGEYSGRSVLPERQQRLNRFLNLLQKIAQDYELAVVFTNQVVSDPDDFATRNYVAAGGLFRPIIVPI
jgi:DNA repair protein RadA